MIRRLVMIAIALGVAGGGLAALLIPKASRPGTAVAAPTPTAATTVQRVGRPFARPEGTLLLAHVTGERIATRVHDPRGGPDWAVRTFVADRVVPKALRRHGVDPVVGHGRCAQLGRVYRGRFGWLDAAGTFRPARHTLAGVPSTCGTDRRPFGEVVEPMTDPEAPAARVVEGVVWGLGAARSSARLTVGGRPHALARGADGALLAVVGPDVRARDVGLTVSGPGRTAHHLLPTGGPSHRLPGFMRRFERAKPGAPQIVAATAPDPDGGLPWPLIVRRGDRGGWCQSQGGRLVGERWGTPDYQLDVLREDAYGASTGCLSLPLKGHLPGGRSLPPYALSSSYGGGIGDAPGADPRLGRVQRRELPGVNTFSGIAEPDVKSLTFSTPADVRTIVPTGPPHAFIVVYAGSFPTGRVTITTTFNDGRTRTDSEPGAMF